MNAKKSALTIAIGSAFAASLAAPAAHAADNPFGMQALKSGYMVAEADMSKTDMPKTDMQKTDMQKTDMQKAGKAKDGRCGGKTATEMKAKEGKCGDKKDEKK